jgi:carboxymethylenebutenolidase
MFSPLLVRTLMSLPPVQHFMASVWWQISQTPPHLLVDKIQAALLMSFAEDDPLVPDNVMPDLKTSLDTHKVNYQLEVPPDTKHGFCFPERASYVKDAAEDVWVKLFELYEKRLK